MAAREGRRPARGRRRRARRRPRGGRRAGRRRRRRRASERPYRARRGRRLPARGRRHRRPGRQPGGVRRRRGRPACGSTPPTIPTHCSFTPAGPSRRGAGRSSTVSTGGHSPALASWLRDQLDRRARRPSTRRCSTCVGRAAGRPRRAGRSDRAALDWRAALDSGMLDLDPLDGPESRRSRRSACRRVCRRHRTEPPHHAARPARADDDRRRPPAQGAARPRRRASTCARRSCSRPATAPRSTPSPSGSTAPTRTSATSSPRWRSSPPEEFADHLYVHYDARGRRATSSPWPPGSTRRCSARARSSARCSTAWEQAADEGAAGPVLNLLFRHALEVGKRARTDTAIARGITSVSHAAVAMAAERLGVARRPAGARARRRRHGRGHGARRWPSAGVADVLGRQPHLGHGRARWPTASAARPSAWPTCPPRSPRSTCCSPPPAPLDAGRRARRPRPGHGRRGTAGRCSSSTSPCPATSTRGRASLPGVTLLDMDDLRRFAEAGIAGAAGEVAGASSRIIDDELERFLGATSAREAAPLVAAPARPGRGRPRRPSSSASAPGSTGSTTASATAVEALTRGIVAKLLHEPTVALKDAAGTPTRRAPGRGPPRPLRPRRPEPSPSPAVRAPGRHARQPARPLAGRPRRRAARAPPTRRSTSSSWSSTPRATAASTCRSRSSAARACSPRRCRPRCSTAGPTSPCTRPRTCRRSPSPGLVLAAVPGAGRSPRRARRLDARRPARRAPRVATGSLRRRAQLAAASARTSRSPSCAATCTPAWPRPPSSTPSWSPPPPSSGSASPTTSPRSSTPT